MFKQNKSCNFSYDNLNKNYSVENIPSSPPDFHALSGLFTVSVKILPFLRTNFHFYLFFIYKKLLLLFFYTSGHVNAIETRHI